MRSVYLFEILEYKGAVPVLYTVDLKNGKGKITKGRVGSVDATFTMLDDDFIELAMGKITTKKALVTGKIGIKGNIVKAWRFSAKIIPGAARL